MIAGCASEAHRYNPTHLRKFLTCTKSSELAKKTSPPIRCRRSALNECRVVLAIAAICMRIILSQGMVNIFNLAKNAGTSVEQIERLYARNLPLSREMAKNLQSLYRQPVFAIEAPIAVTSGTC